jgi:hypothetical protein
MAGFRVQWLSPDDSGLAFSIKQLTKGTPEFSAWREFEIGEAEKLDHIDQRMIPNVCYRQF